MFSLGRVEETKSLQEFAEFERQQKLKEDRELNTRSISDWNKSSLNKVSVPCTRENREELTKVMSQPGRPMYTANQITDQNTEVPFSSRPQYIRTDMIRNSNRLL